MWKSVHDRIGRPLGYQHAEADPDHNVYTVSQKNVNDVAHYNFNAHQPIMIIFGRDIAE